MEFKTIRYEIVEQIATITLHRPAQMNAFTLEMGEELIQAFSLADNDDAVRVVVVTGVGKTFCAGMDLTVDGNKFGLDDHADVENNPELIRDAGGKLALAIYQCRKPIIAAINGAAVGIGITMTLPMDIRLVTPEAKLGFVFAQRGIVPEACSSWFLPRLVGVQQALEWFYTAEIFSGEEALAGGLVRSVHRQEELLSEAYAIARKIADKTSSISIALTRQMVLHMQGADHPMEAHKVDSRAMFYTSISADGKEGVDSFTEKRPANFQNKVSTDMPAFYPWWDEKTFS